MKINSNIFIKIYFHYLYLCPNTDIKNHALIIIIIIWTGQVNLQKYCADTRKKLQENLISFFDKFYLLRSCLLILISNFFTSNFVMYFDLNIFFPKN